jgi:aminoglycoside/choline kinase family phosphotransferase
VTRVERIRAEASSRAFYRLHQKTGNLIAMVYPEDNRAEIERIIRFSALYGEHGLHVPRIIDRLDDRSLLLQDCGDLSLQRAFRTMSAARKRAQVAQVADILLALRAIPPESTAAVLDRARLKWEMDFFMRYYAPHYLPGGADLDALRQALHRLVDQVGTNDTFAHRDFHSRNLHLLGDRIYLIDFQDSLVAPPLYDTVSFAFDAYLDLGPLRARLLADLEARGLAIDPRQLHLSALQRNIKALGTFGCQVVEKEHRSYARYMPRTLRHIRGNPQLAQFLDPGLFA